MKTFIVTAQTGANREAVIHCITADNGNYAEFKLRQQYPDAVRVRAVNARDVDRRLASTATPLAALEVAHG